MRTISPDLAAALAQPATQMCRCWRLSRRDGAVLGFTDHDRDLVFGGVTFRAASGLQAAEAESAAGLAVGGGDVHGALAGDSLTESDLSGGLYDGASVEIWLVDWSDVSKRVLLDVAAIGEVRRTEFSFVAELRSLAHRFDQEQGRAFQRNCSADLGDGACKLDLSSPLWSVSATIASIEPSGALVLSLDQNFSAGFFTDGMFETGGATFAIKQHEKATAGDRVELWSEPRLPLAPGARATLRAGCDKSPETCAKKFDNIVNFRGFPHMPGNDVVAAYPNAAGAPMDGGSLMQ